MLFNSIEFLIFFPIVTLLYFILPFNMKWSMLLAASCFFYMFFKPVYILILFFTIVIDYYAGIWVEDTKDKTRKKKYLVLSLIANIGVLVVFKYFNFLNDNITGLASLMGYTNPIPYLNILLPIGLSFHTFQAMSYTIEVYRGNQKAERHFGYYSLYVMFYPQLVAGPIERPQNILHQLHEKHSFSYLNVVTGLNYMAYGMFKKVVIADRLSPYVNEVYGNIGNYGTVPVLIAMFFFSIQIYCDFSGYSDIAIGSARVMGINLMKNFNFPYLSKTISEFWTRWHISLSTWFKDYLYISLGGNRVSKIKWYRNLAIVFLVSGLWHGASWNFIIWGGLHAFFLIFGIMTLNTRESFSKAIGLDKIPSVQKLINIGVTFALVTFAWIFFRSPDLATSVKIIQTAVSCNWDIASAGASFGLLYVLLCFGLIGLFLFSYLLPKDFKFKYNILFFTVITILILILGKNGESEFIYFQF